MRTCCWPWGFWIRTKFHVCGIDVNLLAVWHWANYFTLLSCNFLLCKKKMIPLEGWAGNGHPDSQTCAFNFDPLHQVQWLSSPMVIWESVKMKEPTFQVCEVGLKNWGFEWRCEIECFCLPYLWASSRNCNLQAKSRLLPILVNRVLLAHSHAHLFMYYLWLLSGCCGRDEWLQQRPYKLQSLRYLLCKPLQINL